MGADVVKLWQKQHILMHTEYARLVFIIVGGPSEIVWAASQSGISNCGAPSEIVRAASRGAIWNWWNWWNVSERLLKLSERRHTNNHCQEQSLYESTVSPLLWTRPIVLSLKVKVQELGTAPCLPGSRARFLRWAAHVACIYDRSTGNSHPRMYDCIGE